MSVYIFYGVNISHISIHGFRVSENFLSLRNWGWFCFRKIDAVKVVKATKHKFENLFSNFFTIEEFVRGFVFFKRFGILFA